MERDGDGFLVRMDDWTRNVMYDMAKQDGFVLEEEMTFHIEKAREYYEENGVVPPLRKFCKEIGVDSKTLYGLYKAGPMKVIAKYGGLPKPTGCV